MSLDVFKLRKKPPKMEMFSVQQDGDGTSPMVFRPLTSVLVPQAEDPRASFTKRLPFLSVEGVGT